MHHDFGLANMTCDFKRDTLLPSRKHDFVDIYQQNGRFQSELTRIIGEFKLHTFFFHYSFMGIQLANHWDFFHHQTFTHGNLMVNNDSWDLLFQGDDDYPMITRITGISHLDKLEYEGNEPGD